MRQNQKFLLFSTLILFIVIKKKINIIGPRIFLKILTEKDATEKYCSWINNADINKYLDSKKTTIKDLVNYINQRYNNPNCLFFGIFLKDTGEHIGNIKLEPINFEKKIATLGILIGEQKEWNRGLGTEALNILIQYCFEILKLNEINLGVYKENVAAIKAYKKSGFKIYDEDHQTYKLKVKKS